MKSLHSSNWWVVGWIAGCAALLPIGAGAQVILAKEFVTPDFRGESETAFDGWAGFLGGTAVSPSGGPGGNAANWAASGGDAYLRQTAVGAGAMITGGGSFYSFREPMSFEIEQTLSFEAGMVALQMRTSGSLPDYDSVFLRYQDEATLVSLAPTPFGGMSRIDLFNETEEMRGDISEVRESLWQWDLSEIAGITNYTVVFDGVKEHLNLQAVALDASATYSAIPEPASVTLCAGIFAGAGILLVRRRRNLVRAEKEIAP